MMIPGGIECEGIGEDVGEVEGVDVPGDRRRAVGLGCALVRVWEGLTQREVTRDERAVLGGGD